MVLQSMPALILYFYCLAITLHAIKATAQFYGNDIRQRLSSGNANLMEPGGRMYVDDPLSGTSWPGWGFLTNFLIFIDVDVYEKPQLFLQIWTNDSSVLRKYCLKISIPLENYKSGRLYNISIPVDARGFPVEITPSDRIGFTHLPNFTPVSLTSEIEDDKTATTAHRTYYYRLEWNNGTLPLVNSFYRFSNDALRARMSIGVIVDNAPPQLPSSQYIGYDLICFSNSFGSSKVVILEGLKLVRGRITDLFMRFNSKTRISMTIDLLIWDKISTTKYKLVNQERLIAEIVTTDPYVKIPVSSLPKVTETQRLGFRMPDSSPLCHSVQERTGVYLLLDSDQPLINKNDYDVDALRLNYEFAFGVAIQSEPPAKQSNIFNSTPTNNNIIAFQMLSISIWILLSNL